MSEYNEEFEAAWGRWCSESNVSLGGLYKDAAYAMWNTRHDSHRLLVEALECLPFDMLDREDNLDAAEFVDNCGAFMEAMRKGRTALKKARGE